MQIELITIPGGAVQLGEAEDAHWLDIATFQIGRFPITAAQYQTFVTESGYPPPSYWPNGLHLSSLADHPVVDVTWFDAWAFCSWLNEREGMGYRLPTEAQWEKAARGPEGHIYPWGNTFYREYCNTWEAGAGYTRPVDTFTQGASPYGVMDMAGNVWEWCNSIYRDYPYSDADGREDVTDSDAWRTLRGGSWYDAEWGVRAARRIGSPPSYASQNTGFRIACNG